MTNPTTITATAITPTAITAACLSGLPGIRHGFFTRQGGVSTGVYAALNCGHGSNDDQTAVAENRRRVAVSLGARGAEDVLTLYQVHSATALAVDGPIARDRLTKADGLVTRTPGLVIGVLTADCTPVLFADPQAGVVGAAHAGWRGAIGGVLEATVAAMESLGARRSRIRAAVGPCINQGAYEVGPEFEAEFLALDPTLAGFFERPAAARSTGPATGDRAAGQSHVVRPHFDLPGFVGHQLRATGIDVVEQHATCTFENDGLLFSYRRMRQRGEPDYGRQISAIVVA